MSGVGHSNINCLKSDILFCCFNVLNTRSIHHRSGNVFSLIKMALSSSSCYTRGWKYRDVGLLTTSAKLAPNKDWHASAISDWEFSNAKCNRIFYMTHITAARYLWNNVYQNPYHLSNTKIQLWDMNDWARIEVEIIIVIINWHADMVE